MPTASSMSCARSRKFRTSSTRSTPYYPDPGRRPPAPPLAEIALIEGGTWWRYALVAVAGAGLGALLLAVLG